MSKFLTGAGALLISLCTLAQASDVATILKKADAFRLTDSSAQIETLVQTYKNGEPDKEKRYQVLIRPGGKSLILFRSPGEVGQKVLMSGDDFWMLLPGSARPMRITPLQKLLGDASTGDIATMTWSGDYDGGIKGESTCDGQPCLELELTATRKTLSYQRVVLQVARQDYRPLHADLYASSGRRLKQASYFIEQRDGRPTVTRITLRDDVQTARETVVTTLSSKPRQFGDELFNAMYLSRNDIKL
ncbi:outer membrane lipoprotein-sorting protein [Duganella qianjiadongensis]|uniref:Outer membrane lipoprotein-sorting protein n=1 Tax=Duganella qianjiadongensis TaxID=2692176 RepID=A0ABW9VRV6_9BURK|nr:outer membrane lipoprotein-sorting protein [Duganella qianjiadongensis]MYM41850.1 outer membrane lipoprotein-sorting protein [Duganella qianjiadongensis]